MLFEGTQIISPWLYYLVTRLWTIHTVVMVLFILSGMGVLVGVISTLVENFDYYGDSDKAKQYFSMTKKLVLWFLVPTMVIATLIPSKEDVGVMLGLQALTYENVESAVDIGKDVTEYMQESLIDIIEAVKGEE